MNSLFRIADHPPRSAFPSGAEDLAVALLKSELVAFALIDSGTIVTASSALREMLSGSAPYPSLDGRNLLSLVRDIDRPGVAEFCHNTLREGARAEIRCHLVRTAASPLAVVLTAAPVPLEGVHQLLITFTDVSRWVSEVQAGERSMTFAAYDRATGFPTRSLLLDRAQIALAAARRYRRRAALLRMELDRLKPLLQSLSVEAADEVQSTLAETLRNCVRDCDTNARIDASEFVVLLPEIGKREDAAITAARVVQSIEALFAHNEPRFRVSAHIGVAVYPTDGTAAERLLESAEAAMRRAQGIVDGGFVLADATSSELTALKPLEFEPAYRVGIPEIDAEHRDLVARLNALIDDLAGGTNPKTLEYDVRAVIELLRAHLATEDSLLGRSSLDGSGEARMRNLRFLEELHCILLHVNSQSIALAIRHLYDWMVPHLLPPEKKLVS